LDIFFFFSSRRRHTRFSRDWSSDVCSSDLGRGGVVHVIRLAAVLCAVLGGVAPLAAEADTKERPRLVVWIVVDQMRADYLDRFRSEERRVGKEGSDRGADDD